jgi:hypothetical protein
VEEVAEIGEERGFKGEEVEGEVLYFVGEGAALAQQLESQGFEVVNAGLEGVDEQLDFHLKLLSSQHEEEIIPYDSLMEYGRNHPGKNWTWSS